MRRIDLAYDGGAFHGWQDQPGIRTVQGELEAALARVLSAPIRAAGASRTDAGVHALGQVASAPVAPDRIGDAELGRALNALTGDDLTIVAVREVGEEFHARFSARGKRYRYRIRFSALPSPFDRRYAWHVAKPLDAAAMRCAAAALIGRFDFSSFQATGSEVASPVRELRRVDLEVGSEHLDLCFEGDGFLRHMVRNIVGTLVEVGRGRLDAERMAVILEARDRSHAGPTAPAHGLFLEEVLYPEHFQPRGGT